MAPPNQRPNLPSMDRRLRSLLTSPPYLFPSPTLLTSPHLTSHAAAVPVRVRADYSLPPEIPEPAADSLAPRRRLRIPICAAARARAERARLVGWVVMEMEGRDEGRPCGAEAAGGEEEEDQFDRLPDAVLLDVFNRIGDVKALGRCALVTRRFHALVPLVDSVFVRVDCVIPDDPAPGSPQAAVAAAGPPARGRGALAHIARLVLGGIVRPIQALGQILSPAAASVSRRSAAPPSPPPPAGDVSHHSPSEVLRSFNELRRLRIELPTGELGIEDGVLLKWKADFGSTLGSCVILGASSVSSKPPPPPPPTPVPTAADSSAASPDSTGEPDELGSIPESLYTNGGLRLRVVWTISSLIAASARHFLLQPIIADHSTLESLDLTDADGQGVLTMDKKQLQELRVQPGSASGNSHRTLMPALSMRLWYAPHIELPGGLLLKGATLVAIRPSEDVLREGGGVEVAGPAGASWISDAFEEPYQSAAKVLLKQRTYSLEMNSF